jgi:hypothetical protein
MLDITSRPSAASPDLIGKPLYENCHTSFEPRAGSGGKPQRFCSTDCRRAFNNAQRAPTPPTCIAPNPPAVPDSPQPKPAPAPIGEDRCWVVPFQPRIECSATHDDEVEIEQISSIHSDENVRIHVARSNAVRLARNILFAAGFKSVLIATLDGVGGYSDVEDGDLPEPLAKRGRCEPDRNIGLTGRKPNTP